ncbi:hypothetical protein K474DRAFT_1669361 [Panus rudis PR-1116 ss-1]|nr:hypothetical protein K474DRAFT_1669361 [Panus rudis PR-1116 ss-1]
MVAIVPLNSASPTHVEDVESELDPEQLAFVDSFLEEGQWEGGIATLDILRDTSVKPAPYHIRQLIYLALYPHKIESNAHTVEYEVQQQHTPTAEASKAARDALTSFAYTNTPSSLFRGLPSYVFEDTGDGIYTLLDDNDNTDCDIGKASKRIKEARNIWEFLSEGFLRLDSASERAPQHGSRQHHNLPGQSTPIDSHAWEVLEWTVTVMEKDEILTERTGKPRHSPLLLRQIPPSRSSFGGRWDVTMPMEIIRYCLQENVERRKDLGIRLLSILINVAITDHMDAPMIFTAICSRIATLPPNIIDFVLIALPQSPICAQFKVFLCRYLLKDPSTGAANNTGSRPKPSTKPPRPVPRRAGQGASNPELGATEPKFTVNSQTASTLRPTTIEDVLRSLIQTPLSSNLSYIQQLRIKEALVYSFAMAQRLPQAEGDTMALDRPHLSQREQLVQAVEQSFVATSILNAAELDELETTRAQLISFIRSFELD